MRTRAGRLLMAGVVLLGFGGLTGVGQPAQTIQAPAWETAAGGKMEFEVASVRPSKPGTPFGSTVPLSGLDGAAPVGNLFRADAILMPYIIFAYKISDTNQARGIWDNMPDWAKEQFYSVEARAEGTPTRDQLRLMVQALLADRFKLAVHRDMQMREQYALVLDKPGQLGLNLKPHPAGEKCVNSPTSSISAPAPAKGEEGPHYCGMMNWNADGREHVRMTDVPMAQVANTLSSISMAGGIRTPHSGVDGTGLTGRFDLDLEFMVEVNGPGSNGDASGLTFAVALKKQLGLKLVERKGLVEMLVLDHVERPSEN